MGTTSNYRGDAREFSEGDEHFELMFRRAIDFLDYTTLWGGYGGLKPEDIEKLSDQQSKLGPARAMAIAIEKNPMTEACEECGRTVLVKTRGPMGGVIAQCGRRLSNLAQCRPEGCNLEKYNGNDVSDDLPDRKPLS